MKIYLGENLKKLRRDREVTQEELARFLNVSFQSVSKWETGASLPDVEMLPSIARYFGTTTDALLGVDKLDEDAKMQEYNTKDREFSNTGMMPELLALWREAYGEFPNNLDAVNSLMYALLWRFQQTDDRAFADELIPLAQRLLDESTLGGEHNYRDGAIQVLCLTYIQLKDEENARKYAEMAPYSVVTRQNLMERILKGDELLSYAQSNIAQYLDDIRNSVWWIARNTEDLQYKIHVLEVLARLFETVYEDGDFGFYHDRMTEIYKALTRWYAEARNADEVIRCAKLARHHAHEWDTAVTHKLTAPLMNTQTFDITTFSTSDPNPRASDTTEFLQGYVYDFVRETEEFRQLTVNN
ncbi:MAG: helix-turn-helix transcriptional regulator [Oscillospiraceae bacterium]|jgi:transcriptional regulator with XRE-family HTH domain|nr:helix-turn-helix transcriptional regulator [Oscillospiraceae bacterium]